MPGSGMSVSKMRALIKEVLVFFARFSSSQQRLTLNTRLYEHLGLVPASRAMLAGELTRIAVKYANCRISLSVAKRMQTIGDVVSYIATNTAKPKPVRSYSANPVLKPGLLC